MQSKGIFGGGSCELPLQVTTVIYHRHSNAALGPQRNIVVRGVPAIVYDEGRSIELYSGRVAIDIFSDTLRARAGRRRTAAAAERAGLARAATCPPPVYCPGLSGEVDAQVTGVMDNLPGHICQRAANSQRVHRRTHRMTASGRAISRRRLRNATEPISAGIHSEIAR